MDIKTDEDKGLVILSNGRLQISSSRQDALRQRLDIRLKTQKGTWFLNTQLGIDWLDDILQHRTSKYTIDVVMQKEILKDRDVERIVKYRSWIDETTRTYHCNFSVKLVGLKLIKSMSVLADENGRIILSDGDFAIGVR